MPSSSKKIGVGYVIPDGYRVTRYEALKKLTCYFCLRPIPKGESFTRQTVHGEGPAPRTICTTCRPFRLQPL